MLFYSILESSKKIAINTSKLSFEHKIPQFNSKVLTRNTCLTFLLNYPWKKRFFSKIVLKREDAANNWPGNWVSFTPCIQGLLFLHMFSCWFLSLQLFFLVVIGYLGYLLVFWGSEDLAKVQCFYDLLILRYVIFQK